MKKIIIPFIILINVNIVSMAQSRFLSDIIITPFDMQYRKGYTGMSINFWRYDTCLNSLQMCKYNTATAVSVKVRPDSNLIILEILRGNNSVYQGKQSDDTAKYIFVPKNMNDSKFIRTLRIKDKYWRTDTFNLAIVDSLVYENHSAIKKAFGKSEAGNQRTLKIHVLKSLDSSGSIMYHYWVERIGIIKLADKKCWRYSFEMNDDRNQAIKSLFTGLNKTIKIKYKDPYWLSQPCSFE